MHTAQSASGLLVDGSSLSAPTTPQDEVADHPGSVVALLVSFLPEGEHCFMGSVDAATQTLCVSAGQDVSLAVCMDQWLSGDKFEVARTMVEVSIQASPSTNDVMTQVSDANDSQTEPTKPSYTKARWVDLVEDESSDDGENMVDTVGTVVGAAFGLPPNAGQPYPSTPQGGCFPPGSPVGPTCKECDSPVDQSEAGEPVFLATSSLGAGQPSPHHNHSAGHPPLAASASTLFMGQPPGQQLEHHGYAAGGQLSYIWSGVDSLEQHDAQVVVAETVEATREDGPEDRRMVVISAGGTGFNSASQCCFNEQDVDGVSTVRSVDECAAEQPHKPQLHEQVEHNSSNVNKSVHLDSQCHLKNCQTTNCMSRPLNLESDGTPRHSGFLAHSSIIEHEVQGPKTIVPVGMSKLVVPTNLNHPHLNWRAGCWRAKLLWPRSHFWT